MAISKPSWLRYLLARMNIDIWVLKLRVGDAIEDAIDWVIDKVNLALQLAEDADNKAQEAGDKAVELGRDIRSLVSQEVQDVIDNISTWWDGLGDWWETKRYWVLGVIDAGMDKLRPAIDTVRAHLSRVEAAWDTFRKETLPGLIDIDRWNAFWGGKVETASDWWEARGQQIEDAREAALEPVRDEVNKHSKKLDLIKKLFTEPEEFLYDLLDRMLERFW